MKLHDTVRVTNADSCYSTYDSWSELKGWDWKEGLGPQKGDIGEIVVLAPHDVGEWMLALVRFSYGVIIMGLAGLEKVGECRVGDWVKVTKRLLGHHFDIGEVVQIIELRGAGCRAKSETNGEWSMAAEEFETDPYESLKESLLSTPYDFSTCTTNTTGTTLSFKNIENATKELMDEVSFKAMDPLPEFITQLNTRWEDLNDSVYKRIKGFYVTGSEENYFSLLRDQKLSNLGGPMLQKLPTGVKLSPPAEKYYQLGWLTFQMNDLQVTCAGGEAVNMALLMYKGDLEALADEKIKEIKEQKK